MGKKNIVQVIVALVLMGPLSAIPSSAGSLSSTVAAIENKCGLNKANMLDSLAKANIEHLLSKTEKKIKKLESRHEKYSKKLAMSTDQQKNEYLLCKIKAVEESLKSYHELQQNLREVKDSMAQKAKK